MRVCLLAILCVLICVPGSVGQNAVQLQDVKKIFVDSLGDEEGASAIRIGITDGLGKSGRFEVAGSADEADAVLVGEAHFAKIKEPPLVNPKHKATRTSFHAVATVQLKNKDQQVLWSGAESGDAISGKASSQHVGHKLVTKLVKASTPPEDKK